MAVKHAFTNAHADGADASLVRPSDWNADHIGSGLPSQWSDGGHGDVTATVDDPTKTPITLQAMAGQSADLLIVKDEAGGAVLRVASDGGLYAFGVGTGANIDLEASAGGYVLLQGGVGVGARGNNAYIYGGDGDVTFEGGTVGFVGGTGNGTGGTGRAAGGEFQGQGGHGDGTGGDVVVTAGFAGPTTGAAGASIILTPGAGDGAGSRGAVIFSQAISAPADALLSAGQFALWFDDTNGASALKVKGKSADGTVVTATIPLT